MKEFTKQLKRLDELRRTIKPTALLIPSQTFLDLQIMLDVLSEYFSEPVVELFYLEFLNKMSNKDATKEKTT